jgi:mRNA interferase RelE/StbE
MKYKIVLTKSAANYLKKAGTKVRERVNKALKNLINYYNDESDLDPDIKILKGKYEGLIRLRIGNLRAILKIENNRLIIFVIDIVPRGGAYH